MSRKVSRTMKSVVSSICFIIVVTISVCGAERRPHPTTKPPGPDGPSEEDVQAFKEWEELYQKEYATKEEEDEAMEKYLLNKAKIDAHNIKFENGEVSYTRGTFKYSDMSIEEKRKYLSGVAVPPSEQNAPRSLPDTIFPVGPSSVNYITAGLVGPVLDQGWCSSCWAFSAVGVIDAIVRRKNLTNIRLAPQQLVDCSKRWCWGCSSGWPKYALDYVRDNGLTKESLYSYKANDQNCTYNKETAVTYVNNVYKIVLGGEKIIFLEHSV